MSITPRRASELISLMELMEDTIEYYCDEHMVSGEIAWQMAASLADAKLHTEFNHP
jgi:hypothetical protein